MRWLGWFQSNAEIRRRMVDAQVRAQSMSDENIRLMGRISELEHSLEVALENERSAYKEQIRQLSMLIPALARPAGANPASRTETPGASRPRTRRELILDAERREAEAIRRMELSEDEKLKTLADTINSGIPVQETEEDFLRDLEEMTQHADSRTTRATETVLD